MRHIKQDQVFCTCLRPYDAQGSTMVQCDDCRAWFHCDCLGVNDTEEDLNEIQSKQFRCLECAAKVSQAPPLHPPTFMLDVRRQWSFAKVLQPPISIAPSIDPDLPLSSQCPVVSAVAADLLLLISQDAKSAVAPDLKHPCCIACLSPFSAEYSSHNPIFSFLSRRLCSSCRSLHQSLVHLCVPSSACSIDPNDVMHPLSRSILVQTAAALSASQDSTDIESLEEFQKMSHMLERLIDAWDLTSRLSYEDFLGLSQQASQVLGTKVPCLTLISRHADEAHAIGLRLKEALDQSPIDSASVFNLMQESRMLCCHSAYELQAESVTREIAEISSKIDFFLDCISSPSNCSSQIQPSFDEVENVLSIAESLHFRSERSETLQQHVECMRDWCKLAKDALLSDDNDRICAVAEMAAKNPPFLHPLMLAVEGKMWNTLAGKIIKSDKEFSLDLAVDTLARGERLEEASLSVFKSLQFCVKTASEWESCAQKLCSQSFTKNDAESHLKAYTENIKLICEGASKISKQLELAESWQNDWGCHAEKGFEHMCSLPNLRQIISKYSQFNVKLPCDRIMSELLKFEPGQVKDIIDHSARLLTKKFASMMLKINSGGVSYLTRQQQSNFSCPFRCCPWSGVSFTSNSDMLRHVSRHVSLSEFSDFETIFLLNRCTLQEAEELVVQARKFDDESVLSNPHFISLCEHISRTRQWIDSVDVNLLLSNQNQDEGQKNLTTLRDAILEGVACGLHTPQIETLQKQFIVATIEAAAVSSVPLSFFSIEILLNISSNLGLKPPFGKIHLLMNDSDIFATSILQKSTVDHSECLANVHNCLRDFRLTDYLVYVKVLSSAHPLSPMIPLLGFMGKMTEIWLEKANDILKRNSRDSTMPFLAKTILGWMHWIRWFSSSETIKTAVDQLRQLSIDYKSHIAPSIPCYSSILDSQSPISYMMLLWPISDSSDLHLSNATGDGETISLTPRCSLMAPLPPRWYTDAAPDVYRHAILNRIKKMGGLITASKILCKRKDCGSKGITPDGFCSDECAVQHEMNTIKSSEETRIKHRASARDALSRSLSLSFKGATASQDSVNRLSAAIESSFLRSIPASSEVLPDIYFSLLQNRLFQIRSYSQGCIREKILRGISDDVILSLLSSADVDLRAVANSSSAIAQSSVPSLPALPSLPSLPVLPPLPELASSTLGAKRIIHRQDDKLAKKEAKQVKIPSKSTLSFSISISGTSTNELCQLKFIPVDDQIEVNMSSLPTAIVVQGRLAPTTVASFVKQVLSSSGSSKFIALFQILSAADSLQPPGLVGHVRNLSAMDRVAVAPLGEDCQFYIGLGRQFSQLQFAPIDENLDRLFAVTVLRKGKHALRS